MHQAEAVVGILHMIGKDKSVGDVMNAMNNDELGRSILAVRRLRTSTWSDLAGEEKTRRWEPPRRRGGGTGPSGANTVSLLITSVLRFDLIAIQPEAGLARPTHGGVTAKHISSSILFSAHMLECYDLHGWFLGVLFRVTVDSVLWPFIWPTSDRSVVDCGLIHLYAPGSRSGRHHARC
jgi:hypothetical protein